MNRFRSLFFLAAFLFLQPLYSEDLKLSESRIGFTVIHPFKTVLGKCNKVSVTPVSFTKTTNGLQVPKSVKIVIPVNEIRSGDENRDEHIMESLGYPVQQQITFTSGAITVKDAEWSISGSLTINGITKPVKTIASLQHDDHGTTLSGKFQVLMSDFEVVAPSLLFATAKDEVAIDYVFVLKP